MGSRWLVLAVMLAGCDVAFGLQHVQPIDASDASADPLGHACANRMPAPMFCADFDETPPLGYVSNAPIDLPAAATDVVVAFRSPSTTGPAALWLSSNGGNYQIDATADPLVVTKLEATFSLLIASTNPSNSNTALFTLTLPGVGYPCFVGLEVDESRNLLQLQGHCGPDNSNPHTDVMHPLPSTSSWVDVDLAFDATTGITTVSLDHGEAIAMPFGESTTAAKPSISFGIENTGHPGLAVAFDDITVFAN